MEINNNEALVVVLYTLHRHQDSHIYRHIDRCTNRQKEREYKKILKI